MVSQVRTPFTSNPIFLRYKTAMYGWWTKKDLSWSIFFCWGRGHRTLVFWHYRQHIIVDTNHLRCAVTWLPAQPLASPTGWDYLQSPAAPSWWPLWEWSPAWSAHGSVRLGAWSKKKKTPKQSDILTNDMCHNRAHITFKTFDPEVVCVVFMGWPFRIPEKVNGEEIHDYVVTGGRHAAVEHL